MNKNFDFKSVDVIVGGRAVYGWAEGDDVLQIEFESNDFELTVGADGETTRSKSNNRSATVRLKLQATSDLNDVLNGFYQADRLSNAGMFPFLMKDRSGREIHAAETMWIEKRPSVTYGAKVGTKEWVLKTGDMNSNFGGN